MACLRVRRNGQVMLLPEDQHLNIMTMPGDVILGPVWDCGPHSLVDTSYDTESLVTQDGIMLGNVIRKVTRALGIPHCFKCSGRQRRYNQKGLEVQKRIKRLLRA